MVHRHRRQNKPLRFCLLLIFLVVGTNVYSVASGSEVGITREDQNSKEREWCVQQSHDVFVLAVGAVYDHMETIHGSFSAGPSSVPTETNNMQENAPQIMDSVGVENSKNQKQKVGRLVRLWRKRKGLKGFGIVKQCLKRKNQQRVLRAARRLQNQISEKPQNYTKNTKHDKLGRIRRVWNGVKKLLPAGTNSQSIDATTNKKEAKDEKALPKFKRKAFERIRNYSKFEAEEDIAGTRLLSGSFQMLSSAAGFLADTVRVSGDTAAGIMGSSVKLFGTAVKSMGTGLSSASQRLDKSAGSYGSGGLDNNDSTQVTIESYHPSWRHRQKKKYGNIGKHTRRVAAKSVRLIGSMIGGVGESLLIAGVAAESLTSSTAGVAEETVRIFENLAGTISVALSLKGRRRRTKANNSTQDSGALRKKLSPYFLSFGTYDNNTLKNGPMRLSDEEPMENILDLIELLVGDATNFWTFLSADTEEVPSMAVELLTALVLCYLFTIVLLPTRQTSRAVESSEDTGRQPQFLVRMLRCFLFPISVQRGFRKDAFTQATLKSNRWQACFRGIMYSIKQIMLLPFRALKFSLISLFQFTCNRKVLLLVIYGLIWAYLATLSQERALLVQRRAEAIGFRNGITKYSDSSPQRETVVWLNNLLDQLWRVPREEKSEFAYESTVYPSYVLRTFREQRSQESYGGLEPQLSSLIGKGIVKGLEAAKTLRPSDIAYVSLFSLSLGKRAPVIRTVEVLDSRTKFRGNATRVELNIDLDALFEDMSIVLEVKLSTLAYAILPSTKINVHSLDFRTSIKLVLLVEPDYPFLSSVELSMLRQPECNLRITPLGNDSGLKGVDLGSLPFLKDWIKDAIQSTLSDYVAPHYINLDLAAVLNSYKPSVASVSPYIETLRQKTSFPLSDPRTSTPEGIAITSVAGRLESHQSSTQVIRPEIDPQQENNNERRNPSKVKPITELSRLAFDRYTLKEGNRIIRPATELSKMAMDLWLENNLSKGLKASL